MLKPGSRIREYEILGTIGSGGMAAVYRARHTLLQCERAIKVIQNTLQDDSIITERFIREARILSEIEHPNLVRLHEFGVLEDGPFFMVLELVEGETVLQRIRRLGRISIVPAAKIIQEAAQGLAAAHKKGIVHRDISPDNLMIVSLEEGEERTKVIDFGIAKALVEGRASGTTTGMFVGKPEYCSPEQCGLDIGEEEIDKRSDIYSLGITLYHMVSGQLPFFSPTPQGYMYKHLTQPPKSLTEVFPGEKWAVPVDAVLARALAKNREERFPCMEDFLLALQEADEVVRSALLDSPERKPQTRELQIGELFAQRYRIDKKLGQGGMGAVYKAVDTELQVPVALKLLKQGFIRSSNTLERFKREVVTARKVAHVNVCRLFDIGQFQGVHYVTMEYVEGTTLSQAVRNRSKSDLAGGLPIVAQILSALESIHQAGVVHRDLKPENIMIGNNGRVCIMDFGISLAPEMQRMTETGMLVGTPHYMAPEHMTTGICDQRSDLYSVGVILFEMFTGRRPFEGNTPMNVILAHVHTPIPDPAAFAPEIPPALQAIITRALEKSPENRYQTAAQMLADIHGLEDPPATTPRVATQQQPLPLPKPAPPVEQPPNQARPVTGEIMSAKSSGLFWLGAVAVIVVLFAGVKLIVWPGGGTAPEAKHDVDISSPAAPSQPRRVQPAGSLRSDATTVPSSAQQQPPAATTPENRSLPTVTTERPEAAAARERQPDRQEHPTDGRPPVVRIEHKAIPYEPVQPDQPTGSQPVSQEVMPERKERCATLTRQAELSVRLHRFKEAQSKLDQARLLGVGELRTEIDRVQDFLNSERSKTQEEIEKSTPYKLDGEKHQPS